MFFVEETGSRQLSKIVLTDTCEASAPAFFYAKARYFVREQLLNKMQQAQVQGIAFAPLDAAYHPSSWREMVALEQHLHEQADDWASWYELSLCLQRMGRREEALAALEKVLSLNAHLVEAWYKRAQLLRKIHRFEEALRATEQAIALEPTVSLWYEYCENVLRLHRFDQLLAKAKEGMAQWGEDSPIFWYYIAAVYDALHEHDQALHAVNRGLDLGGGGYREELLLLKGSLLYKQGRYQEALATYDMLGLRRGAYWQERAKVLYALGHEEEAHKAEAMVHHLEQERHERMKKLL